MTATAGVAPDPGGKFPRTLAAIFLLALTVRSIYLFELRGSPVEAILLVDSLRYDAWARELAGGAWLGPGVFYQAPLYPYFLGLVYAIAGPRPAAAVPVQVVLGSASCVVLALAGRRWFGERAGLIAGVLLALYPTAVFSDALLQKSVLDILLVCLLLAALGAAQATPTPRRWFAAGLALGVLILSRENAFLLLPVLLLQVVLRSAAPRRQTLPARLLAAALGLGLALAPAALRNLAVGGEFLLTTSQFGANLYIGNHPGAEGIYVPLRANRDVPQDEQRDARELAEAALGRRLTPGEVSRYWRDEALRFILGNPFAWSRLLARKLLLTLNAVEVPDAYDQQTYGDWSALLRWLNRLCHFGVLFPLAAAGTVVTWGRRRSLWPLHAFFLVYASSVALFYALARYRFPLVPVLILFAAAFLTELCRRPSAGASRRLLGPAAALAVTAVLANWPQGAADKRAFRALMLNNVATDLIGRQGRPGEALPLLEEAMRIDPAYITPPLNRGVALRALGRADEAVEAFLQAEALWPSSPEAAFQIAQTLRGARRVREAVPWYRRALAIDPARLDLHTTLGVALFEAGDVAGATTVLERALAIRPESAEVLGCLGAVYLNSGDLTRAERYLTAALVQDSARGDFHRMLGATYARQGRAAEAARQISEAERLPRGQVAP